jgi:hypothetical protein
MQVTGQVQPKKQKNGDCTPINFDYWIARMYVTEDETKAHLSLLGSPFGDLNCYYWLLTPRVTISPADSYHVVFGGDPSFDPTDLPALGKDDWISSNGQRCIATTQRVSDRA